MSLKFDEENTVIHNNGLFAIWLYEQQKLNHKRHYELFPWIKGIMNFFRDSHSYIGFPCYIINIHVMCIVSAYQKENIKYQKHNVCYNINMHKIKLNWILQ